LKGINGITFLEDIKGVDHSYSYFPIFIDASVYGKKRDEIYEELRCRNIYSRRYFYHIISQFPTYQGLPTSTKENLPVASDVAEKVICLPI